MNQDERRLKLQIRAEAAAAANDAEIERSRDYWDARIAAASAAKRELALRLGVGCEGRAAVPSPYERRVYREPRLD